MSACMNVCELYFTVYNMYVLIVFNLCVYPIVQH